MSDDPESPPQQFDQCMLDDDQPSGAEHDLLNNPSLQQGIGVDEFPGGGAVR
jgi:hypothetical protein